MGEDFVDMCAVCKQGVSRESMVYQKGRVFHQQCFNDHGSSFPAPNKEIDSLSAKTRVELVVLKNLKAREEMTKIAKPRSKAARKKPAKKRAAKKTVKKRQAKKGGKAKARKAKPRSKARSVKPKRSKKAAKKRPRRR